MIKKSTIIALSALSFICTSAYAQDWKDNWRNSPLSSKPSNAWISMPYTTKTSTSWRNSALSARQSESKLRWNISKWQKSPSYWKYKPYTERPITSDRWQNRWDKKKWRYSPLNWRCSELRYKNIMSRYESEPNVREVRVYVLSDDKSGNESVPEEKKEYAKAQIETITQEAETDSKKTSGNYFIVISGKQTFRIEKSVQKTVHMPKGGLMEIYSSKIENP